MLVYSSRYPYPQREKHKVELDWVHCAKKHAFLLPGPAILSCLRLLGRSFLNTRGRHPPPADSDSKVTGWFQMNNCQAAATAGARVVFQVLGLNGVKQRMTSRKVRLRNSKLRNSRKVVQMIIQPAARWTKAGSLLGSDREALLPKCCLGPAAEGKKAANASFTQNSIGNSTTLNFSGVR